MDLTLHVWRQRGPGADGEMKTYPAPGISAAPRAVMSKGA